MEIKEAYDIIREYCLKHNRCVGCLFYSNGECLFEKGIIPCDWEENI